MCIIIITETQMIQNVSLRSRCYIRLLKGREANFSTSRYVVDGIRTIGTSVHPLPARRLNPYFSDLALHTAWLHLPVK